MSVRINKIYVQNYKLFDEKEISFEEGLSVFDGPNGYGKTSIFDALEFLITGRIDRVEKSDVISGSKSYSSNFLAKDPQKDVLIKGEFCNSERGDKLIIALQIPVTKTVLKKTNNPKNVCESANSYILSEFDTPVSEWGQPVEKQTIYEVRNSFFGAQNIEFYKNIHYVQQEDRLAYFKKSEKDRVDEINKLLGIKREEDILQSLESICRQLTTKLKTVKAQIDNYREQVSLIKNNPQKDVEYIELLDGKQPWDKRDLGFKGANSKGVFEKYLSELRAMNALLNFKDIHVLNTQIELFEQIPYDKQTAAIRAWALEQSNSGALENYYKINENIKFFKGQLALVEQLKYRDLNYNKLCEILELRDKEADFNNILNALKSSQANQTELQKSVSRLTELRDSLRNQSKNLENWNDGQCPYCGQIWTDAGELDKKFDETEKLISASIGRENLIVKKLLLDLKNEFEKNCLIPMRNYISEFQHNEILEIFADIGSLKQLQALALKCEPILKRLDERSEIELAKQVDNMSYKDYAIIARVEIENLKQKLTAEYINAREQYGFDHIYRTYFEGKNNLNLLNRERIDLKILYIQNQFNASFDETLRKLNTLIEQNGKLSDIKNICENYKTALKFALNKYRDQVVKQIEIPFFLYSSRLLQSYQSGQGVMIQSSGDSIRFCVPGGEHDVLYTMSSGQLSAVLLSFSLALNKIYAGDNFNTLLIDDPIQCMDDINMLSFVELLRQEFNGLQIIMSTHEDMFSNFIRYKFGKFNQKCKQINLQDEN